MENSRKHLTYIAGKIINVIDEYKFVFMEFLQAKPFVNFTTMEIMYIEKKREVGTQNTPQRLPSWTSDIDCTLGFFLKNIYLQCFLLGIYIYLQLPVTIVSKFHASLSPLSLI